MRKPLVAANWKMHKTVAEALAFAQVFMAAGEGWANGSAMAEVVLCPPFTAIAAVAHALRDTMVAVGAQNLHGETEGAYTGEISAGMLVAAGCRYVIVGHSERRRLFAESDETVRRKLFAALQAGLRPILCVGETLAQREAGGTDLVIGRQLAAALADANGGVSELVIAYEPVWAIGSGRAATPADAQAACAHLRRVLAQLQGADVAADVRILYGGSVKPDNIHSYCDQPDVDGALVGGASLDPHGFADLVRNSM